MRDVKFTLLLTVVLVVLVIFLFLRNISATIIPSLALPGSIVATFAVMYLLDYSLDNLSLMALTLSVGFVVDDAIVMLENIVRHMEMGKPPMQAALDGSKEIAFTIVSMTVSLTAVFIPVLFMGGIVGRLLHEFAVTIGVGDPGVGVRVDQPDADAVQPVPEAAAHAAGTAVSTTRSSGCSTAWLRLYDCTLRVGAALPRGHDGACRSRCWSAPVYLFMLRPEGLPAERGPGALQHQHRGDPGHRLRRHGAAPARGGRDRRARIRTSSAARSNVGRAGPAAAAAEQRPHRRRPEAARSSATLSVDQVIARAAAEAGADSRHPRLHGRTSRRSISAASSGARSLYQFTLQDTDTDELYEWAPKLEAKMRELPGSRT